jgi:hypothetical protein
MARLDWKRGARFQADAETNRVFTGMAGWRDVYGDWCSYYRFNAALTVTDPIYDEAVGTGRMYYPPIRVPCLHVVHVQGENEYGQLGYYFNDTLTVTCSFDQFGAVGLMYSDIETGNFLQDRIVYDREVYRVVQMSPRGKIQERSTVIQIECSQLKPDEMYDDLTFQQYVSAGDETR